jgi:MarR-like DNA-binding transcriptional regulator SgrR of sgrS sRNA
MPYFGVLHKDNFNEINGSWKNETNIVSSGPYRLKKFNSNKVSLQSNSSFYITPKQFINIDISLVENDKLISSKSASIILSLNEIKDLAEDSYLEIMSIPTWLTMLMLNPSEKSCFHSLENRKAIQKDILKILQSTKSNESQITIAKNFYSQMPSVIESILSQKTSEYKSCNKTLLIPFDRKKIKRFKTLYYLIESLEDSFQMKNQKFKYDTNSSQNGQKEKFDLTLKTVNVGGGPESWVIDMMFNSKLGARLPDPYNKISNLTEEFNLGKINFENYTTEFSNAIYDDAAVIPLFFLSSYWYFTKDINLPSGTQIYDSPRFEELTLK